MLFQKFVQLAKGIMLKAAGALYVLPLAPAILLHVVFAMKLLQFDVLEFIGKGCYSMVYEIMPKNGSNEGDSFAFKRIFIQDPAAVECAKRERNILVRLAEGTEHSPFLPTLYFSYLVKNSPILILRSGSGFDLFHLLTAQKVLLEHDARFYASEIICGLEHLHGMQIVHLDLKPENILLEKSGHIFITDFDRSFDLSLNLVPKTSDFGGTLSFMAPEVAKELEISPKADVWSLAVLMAEMVSGPIRNLSRDVGRNRQMAKKGSFVIRDFKRLTQNLQAFFNACLKLNPKERIDIAGVKKLKFFKFVDWGKVIKCSIKPPFNPSDLENSLRDDFGVNRHDPLLLDAAFAEHMPLIRGKLETTVTSTGERRVVPILPNTEKLNRLGMTPEKILEHLGDFSFIHPSLRMSNGVDMPNSTDCEISDIATKSHEMNFVRRRHISKGD